MKHLSIFLFIYAVFSASLLAQTPRADVLTPKGSNVKAYIPAEMSNQLRGYWDSQMANIHPQAQQILTYGAYSSTNRFNCHGYAW